MSSKILLSEFKELITEEGYEETVYENCISYRGKIENSDEIQYVTTIMPNVVDNECVIGYSIHFVSTLVECAGIEPFLSFVNEYTLKGGTSELEFLSKGGESYLSTFIYFPLGEEAFYHGDIITNTYFAHLYFVDMCMLYIYVRNNPEKYIHISMMEYFIHYYTQEH